VQTEQAFKEDADLLSVGNVIKRASIGAFAPETSGESVANIDDVITKYPAGSLTEETVLEFTDEYGRLQRRKNAISWVMLGNSTDSLKLRNPG
jgi:hypothetical protein